MNFLVAWSDFYTTGDGGANTVVRQILAQLSTANLLSILAGVVGVTIAYTLIWRFAAYIRNVVTGGLTNSKRKK